jgi:hypothetical protein
VKPTEDQIKQEIIHSNTVGSDETGTRASGRNFWIHASVTNLFSHFQANIKRGMEGINASGILENFHGTLVHDFFKPYLNLSCKHAFCNAHILRELIGVYETTSQVWADQMIQVLIMSLDAKKDNSPNIPNQDVIQEILILYDKAIQLGHKENPEIPFDNAYANFSERALRMIKVKNKISGCFRSKEGIEYFCQARSFIDTCRKHKMNILKSIAMIFNNTNFRFSAE